MTTLQTAVLHKTVPVILCTVLAGCASASANDQPRGSDAAGNTAFDASELFTDRDLRQQADESNAVSYILHDNETISLTKEGVYVISGTAENAMIFVDAPKSADVQIVLDNAEISNTDMPAICALKADKLFVTTAKSSKNRLSVSRSIDDDAYHNADGAVFSRCDLTLNGLGSLSIESADNGIVCKDDLRITGGTLSINVDDSAVEANDSIAVYDGTITLKAANDGLHAENDDDDTLGFVVIKNGTITIECGDDAIHGQSRVVILDGVITLSGREGIESTDVLISGGTLNIQGSDDCINAGHKSDSLPVQIVISGGNITLAAKGKDADAIDSNGAFIVNGGTLDIRSDQPFDVVGSAEYNGGTIIVNGKNVNKIK